MKTVQFDSFGPAHQVAYCAEVPDPGVPADDEVLVDVLAFPINPADLLTIEGKYAVKPPLPYTPGAEAVGQIIQTGSEAEDLLPGDHVMLLSRENWAQKRRVKANEVLKIQTQPDRLLQYAMLKVNPATAALMLRDYVKLNAGDWIIQDAANSGVGHCVIRLAARAGIRTINVVRRVALAGPLEATGADAVLVGTEALSQRVSEITNNVRLALDAVAGETSLSLTETLGTGGVLVNYGMLSGEPCKVMPDALVFRQLTLTGFWLANQLGSMARTELESLYTNLAGNVRDGTLDVNIEATYDITEIKDALNHAGQEGRNGKILVLPNGTP